MLTDNFFMAFQLKLLGLWVFLGLTLSLCHANNVTVKVVGVIHCSDCITNQTTSDINISIHCKSKNQETKTQANGVVDKEGNFNVTLSADIRHDDNSIDGCYAKLQSASPNPCPIQRAQTASVKLISIKENAEEAQNKPTEIKFSPITCQSAFFWPFPNVTFFPFFSPPPQNPPPEYSPPPQNPPPEYSPPPSEALTPLSPPVQPPSPPEVDPITPPAPASKLPYSPPVSPPSHKPKRRSAAPPPKAHHQSPPLLPTPSISPTSPPPHAFHRTPSMLPTPSISPTSPPPHSSHHRRPSVLPTPIPSPASPPTHAFHRTPSVPPISVLPLTPPPQKQPKTKKSHTSPAPVSAPATPPELENPIPNPPNVRKPSPIPRAPPVPKLPPFPTVPRKYFNSPKSRSQPPRSSYPSHS